MFYQRLHKICKEKGTSVTRVVREIGLSSANLTNWKNGRLPKTEIAFKIAAHLGVSIYDLMGETEQKEKPSLENEERLLELYELTKGLDENEIIALKAFAAGLKANRK